MIRTVDKRILNNVTQTHGNKFGYHVYANGRSGGTVVTIILLFTFIMILLTVCLPTHLEQTKSVCVIIYLHAKKKNFLMLEMVREANKIINNFRGEHEVYNIDLFIFLQEAYWRNDFNALC
jgi:hypothetical protein